MALPRSRRWSRVTDRAGSDGGPSGSFTYLTVCSSDDYLEGVVALHRSLRKVRSAYPLTVLVTSAVPEHVDGTLRRLGIRTVRSATTLPVPREIIDRNSEVGVDNWSRTFDKLQAFALLEFDKIVHLDSDMMVMKNVDELFDRPHMSAVVAGRSFPGNESWELLNSGCLVIAPREGEQERLWQAVPEALTTRKAIGDQDLLQVAHPRWADSPDLHLGEEYNVFFPYLEHYTRTLHYSLSGARAIKILHFVGTPKPWQLTPRQTLRGLARHLRHRQWRSLVVSARYQVLLLEVRLRIARAQRTPH